MPCNLQPAIVGLNSLPRLRFFLVCVFASGVDGQGSVQRSLCEPRQDREVAAAAELFLVLQIDLARANDKDNAEKGLSERGAQPLSIKKVITKKAERQEYRTNT